MLESSFRNSAEVLPDPAITRYLLNDIPAVYCVQDLETGRFIQYNDLFHSIGLEQLLKNQNSVLQDGTEKTVEFITDDGIKKYFRLRTRVQKEQNKTLRVVTGTEVFVEKQNEFDEPEVIRSVYDRSPEYIFMTDITGEVVYANTAACGFIGGNMQAIRQELTRADSGFLKQITDKVSRERKSFNCEIYIHLEKGNYRWVSVLFISRYNRKHQFTGLTGFITDIHTEKKQKDLDSASILSRSNFLEEENKNLQRSNGDLEQFAYVASHDLQEPLRKIKIFSERLKTSVARLPASDKIYLHKIQEATGRMTSLIHDLLNYSILTQQKETFHSTDMRAVIKTVVHDYELRIAQTGARIELRNLPVIDANAVMMNQLFFNLIGNSLKFVHPDRKPVISISGVLTEDKNDKAFLEITIKDNGIGFDPLYAESIFTLFTRLNTRQAFNGSGIGLALCRKLVEAHSGTISAESDGENGSVFRILLPVKQAA